MSGRYVCNIDAGHDTFVVSREPHEHTVLVEMRGRGAVAVTVELGRDDALVVAAALVAAAARPELSPAPSLDAAPIDNQTDPRAEA